MNIGGLLEQGFWAFVATTGFAVLFNVPTRMLAVSGFTGAMGLMWRNALLGRDPLRRGDLRRRADRRLLGYTQARSSTSRAWSSP